MRKKGVREKWVSENGVSEKAIRPAAPATIPRPARGADGFSQNNQRLIVFRYLSIDDMRQRIY
ncbi:hypothetical protein A9D14_11805 [Croceicoccus marinus]|uniref:Uncharacterized protein n=1 Tax=Croceicoccus marinus TaxID=450378 RepID=A0A1Z1FDI0_9SPHN|nr:hypothetical protein A9D14_11805 [Croceicoccus marinus]